MKFYKFKISYRGISYYNRADKNSSDHWYTLWSKCNKWLCGKSGIGHSFNLLAPGKFERHFRSAIFKQILVIAGWGISYEIALIIWMPLDLTDDQSTLVQVMAWCCWASHYLSQCWPKSLSRYGVTRPQWVKLWLTITYVLTITMSWPFYLMILTFKVKVNGLPCILQLFEIMVFIQY